jgi:uncharacterized membrane protein YesL
MRNKKFEQITRRSFSRLTLNALYINTTLVPVIQEPIVRLLNLQLQRQRCGRLERFFQIWKQMFCFQNALGYILIAL